VLAASVPDVEVPRSDVVAARLARKVGPLFGIVWEQNPFGRTWVCDFGSVTLAEIARGAPYPPRDVQACLDQPPAPTATADRPGSDADDLTEWRLAGRAVWTPRRRPTPAALTHATLNRYGPDTKAAVVLTGANRLLREVTTAVAGVCRDLVSKDIAPELRLAVWSGLILDAFRAQPALVAAAIQARAVQRALTTPWGQHLWLRGLTDSARCEFGALGVGDASGDTDRPQEPTRFDLVDATLLLLRLPVPVTDGPLYSEREILDDIVSRWCGRLLQIGHPGRGITWVTETAPGHRSVQCYVRTGSVIAPFVADAMMTLNVAGGAGTHVSVAEAAGLLDGVELAELPRLARRAHLISAHVLANYLRFHDGLLLSQPELREATRELCDRAEAAALTWLGPDDPASLLLAGYAAYLHAWDLAREAAAAGSRTTAAVRLAAELGRLADAWRRQLLDPGTASYLLEIGAMALERLRTPDLDSDVAQAWHAALLARGIDPDRDLDDPRSLPGSQQYHLQNYASFLAVRAASAADLRRALAAQRACVQIREQVTHGEPAAYSAKLTSARTSRQAAAAIIGRLLPVVAAAGGEAAAEYQELLAEGVGHARAAIENPTTAALLGAPGSDAGGADPELVRFALAVFPVITMAAEYQRRADDAPVLVDAALLAAADRLMAAADDAVARAGGLPEADWEARQELRAPAPNRALPGGRRGKPHVPALPQPPVQRCLIGKVHAEPVAHEFRGDLVPADGLVELGWQPRTIVGPGRAAQHLACLLGVAVETAPFRKKIPQSFAQHWSILTGWSGSGFG